MFKPDHDKKAQVVQLVQYQYLLPVGKKEGNMFRDYIRIISCDKAVFLRASLLNHYSVPWPRAMARSPRPAAIKAAPRQPLRQKPLFG